MLWAPAAETGALEGSSGRGGRGGTGLGGGARREADAAAVAAESEACEGSGGPALLARCNVTGRAVMGKGWGNGGFCEDFQRNVYTLMYQ